MAGTEHVPPSSQGVSLLAESKRHARPLGDAP